MATRICQSWTLNLSVSCCGHLICVSVSRQWYTRMYERSMSYKQKKVHFCFIQHPHPYTHTPTHLSPTSTPHITILHALLEPTTTVYIAIIHTLQMNDGSTIYMQRGRGRCHLPFTSLVLLVRLLSCLHT